MSTCAPSLLLGALYVAEIGAGTGQVLREFGRAAEAAGHDVNLIGCEYARSFVAAGREVGTDLREGGIEALAGGAPPDVFIMSHVVEHFADPAAELQQMWRIARPGTLVYVEVPGLMTLHAKTEYEFELSQYLTLAHTYHFTLSTLVQAMARAGFRLLTGDEVVRAVFVREDEATIQVDGQYNGAPQLLTYLRRVDRSPFVLGAKIQASRREACERDESTPDPCPPWQTGNRDREAVSRQRARRDGWREDRHPKHPSDGVGASSGLRPRPRDPDGYRSRAQSPGCAVR